MDASHRHRFAPLALPLVCIAALAQQPGGRLPPAPPAPPTPGVPPAPAVTPAPGKRTAPALESPSPADQPPRSISPRPGTPIAKGTVSRLLPNPDGQVEGLLLSDGTQVRFPPHMSQELASAVRPGSAVAVEGYREAGGAVRARVITDEASGQRVVERDPQPPAAAPNTTHSTGLGPLSVEGRIQQLMRDPAGDVNGVVLEDGSVVRFPANVRRQFPGVLQPGIAVSASGYGTQTRFGRALDATTLGAGDHPPQPLNDNAPKGARGAPR
jgi:hypothetical protein